MKRPSFQFYPKDFLSDRNVMAMTNEQVGVYIKLLCFMWEDEACELPDDLDYLARICQCDNSVITELYHCFNSVEGVLKHKRLNLEREKQNQYKKCKSEAGKKGMEKRWGAKRSQPNNSVITEDNKAITKDNSSSASSTSSSNKKKKLIKKIFEVNSPEFQLSKLMLDQILLMNPKYKVPDLQKWAEHADLMMRVDGRTQQEIEALIFWVYQDSFWKANILSMRKLREKFDQLWLKAMADVERKNSQSNDLTPSFS